jgi:hypothetical protein
VPIRAANIEGFATYRRPAPFEARQRQQVGAPRGIVERYWYDPEDEQQPEPFDPVIPNKTTGKAVIA